MMRPRRRALLLMLAVGVPCAVRAQGPKVVAVSSAGALVYVKVMAKTGSAFDPEGSEGLAYLAGNLLIEGGYGDAKNPVTKEKLAALTRPWGEGAFPSVRVDREITTFSMVIPREVLGEYVARVLRPMFSEPLFAVAELDRVRKETLETIRSDLRFQQIEVLGLVALDNVLHDGTSYAHLPMGTVRGLGNVTPEAVRRFYETWYRPEHLTIGVSVADPGVVNDLRQALAAGGDRAVEGTPFSAPAVEPPRPFSGRHVTLIGLPKAIASGLHAGFPISVTRRDADYWPLYVANVWFGTHRDGFSHLYQVLREERGYNYGDYSYIEHFEDRPFHLFPPTNTPRRYQSFSIWIRPVGHESAHHLMKALTWELENFIRAGLRPDQVEAAKDKARVLYLSLAEDVERLVGYRLDDEFYGLQPGYLDQYLSRIDAVTPEAVNAAIRKYLQVENLQYVVITDAGQAEKLANDIANNQNAAGKTAKDYQIDSEQRGGAKYWIVPEAKLETLRRDAVWESYPLNIPRSNIRVIKAEQMFETASVPH